MASLQDSEWNMDAVEDEVDLDLDELDLDISDEESENQPEQVKKSHWDKSEESEPAESAPVEVVEQKPQLAPLRKNEVVTDEYFPEMGTVSDKPRQQPSAAPAQQTATGGRPKFVNSKKPAEAPQQSNRFAALPLNEADQDSSPEKAQEKPQETVADQQTTEPQQPQPSAQPKKKKWEKQEINIKFTETRHEATTKAIKTQSDVREEEDAKQYAQKMGDRQGYRGGYGDREGTGGFNREGYGDRGGFNREGESGGFQRREGYGDRGGFNREGESGGFRGGYGDRGGFRGGYDNRGDREGFGGRPGEGEFEERPSQPFTRNLDNPDFSREAPARPERPVQEESSFRRSEIQRSDNPVQSVPAEQPTQSLGGWRSNNAEYVSPTKAETAAPQASKPAGSRFSNSAKKNEPAGYEAAGSKQNAWQSNDLRSKLKEER